MPAQNSGIVFGGGSPYTGATEEFDGSAWTTVPGSLNTARGYLGGFGTAALAVAAGGYTSPDTPQSLVEEYNGTSWSEETNLPGTRKSSGGCGTLTAGLIMGGSTQQPYAPNVVDTAFEYDGSSWTSTPGNMPEAKGLGCSGGTQTAAYYAAGRYGPGYTAKTTEYNGSTFSEAGDVVNLTGPPSGFQGATGTVTAGLATGGQPLATNTYDGTTWSTAPSYTTPRDRGMGGGTQAAAIIVGGSGPAAPYTNLTEEFTGETSVATASTLTTS